METRRIAKILFNTSLSFDCMYTFSGAEEELLELTREINELQIKNSSLFNLLETLAYQNESMEDFKFDDGEDLVYEY